MARPKSPSSTRQDWFPRRAWQVIVAAFGVGLLLFGLAWLGVRDEAPAIAEPAAPGEPVARMDPLPRPLPAGDPASDMPDARPPAERPQRVEEAPAPLAPESTGDPGSERLPGASDPGPAVANAAGSQPVPLAEGSPSPRYPGGALRRREQGTVVLRVQVDSDGRVASVGLLERSGSRDLDRAAQTAVRQWRFQPARVDGQPVPGSIDIPVDFRLD